MSNLVGKKIQIINALSSLNGMIATVLIEGSKEGENNMPNSIGVKLDSFSGWGHTLFGRTEMGYGIWLSKNQYIVDVDGFFIGDRVIDFDGDTGTVVCFGESGGEIGVKLDEPMNFHNETLNGHCEDGYGFWYGAEDLRHFDEDENCYLPVGQRVLIINGGQKGQEGEIVVIDVNDNILPYGLRLDLYSPNAGDCCGHTDAGHGLWVGKNDLLSIYDDEDWYDEDDENEIYYDDMFDDYETNDVFDDCDIFENGVSDGSSINYCLDNIVIKKIVNYPATIVFYNAYGQKFKGVAICNEDDVFDDTGYEIAKRRALIEVLKHEIKLLSE